MDETRQLIRFPNYKAIKHKSSIENVIIKMNPRLKDNIDVLDVYFLVINGLLGLFYKISGKFLLKIICFVQF